MYNNNIDWINKYQTDSKIDNAEEYWIIWNNSHIFLNLKAHYQTIYNICMIPKLLRNEKNVPHVEGILGEWDTLKYISGCWYYS